MSTTAELLLDWDRTRPRSQQTELGMSEVGGCRRRAGYRLAGVEPTNEGGSVQAVLGTAIHAAVEQVYRDFQAKGLLPAEDLIEYEVSFGGVLGHLDRYEAGTFTLYDTKSTSDRWLQQHIKVFGADREHTWQSNLYAAALIADGKPVRRIVIDYIARDTGNDHQVVLEPDVEQVREAMQWLRNVRDTPLDVLSRDRRPESVWCQHCPFYDLCWDGAVPGRSPLSVLYVEFPDGDYWVSELREARQEKKVAEDREKRALGALDAVRPNESGDSGPVDVGGEQCLRWNISKFDVLDGDAVKVEYKEAGVKPPMKGSGKTVLSLVPKPDGA
jgi:hypothetical protein